MYDAPGIGLAASQVNHHIRLLVIDITEEKNQPMVFINPVITPLTDATVPYEEGCLSVPSVYDFVERFCGVFLSPLSMSLEEVVYLINRMAHCRFVGHVTRPFRR